MAFTAAMKAPTISVELVAAAKLMFTAKPTIVMKLASAPPIVIAPAAMIPVSAESTPLPIITVPAAMPAPAVPARMAVIPVIPGPYANEHAVYKPLRPVEAVRRAGIRVIIIVAIGANRRRAVVAGAHSDAYNHSLRACKRSAKEANA